MKLLLDCGDLWTHAQRFFCQDVDQIPNWAQELFLKKRTEIHSSNYESNHKTKCLCTFWCSAAAHDQMSFQVQICKITHFFPGAKTHVATKLLFFTKNFQSSNLESRMKEGHKNWGFKTYCNSKKLDLITGENLRSVYGHRGWSQL